MLNRLHISNYALIDELHVGFPGKLTVITGETGAGKSIFLEALGLALGNRADSGVLKNKSKKCIVEAEFNIKAYHLDPFFEEHGLDKGPEVLLRREITAEGKSRAFINDTPVTLQQLKQLSESLIDVHSQHQTLLLNNGAFQFQLLDTFSGISAEADNYRKSFRRLNSLKKELEELSEKEKQAKKEQDYLKFLFDELNETELDQNTFRNLEEQALVLENAEVIKQSLSKTSGVLEGGEENVLLLLNQAKQSLSSVVKFNEEYRLLFERIQAAQIELKDVSRELDLQNDKLIYNPKELDEIHEKTDRINRLMKKHSVSSVEELANIKNELENKLHDFSSLENAISRLEKETEKLRSLCRNEAENLSRHRQKSIAEIEKQINVQLFELAMPNARFKIDLVPGEALSLNGIDGLAFRFSANKGGEFKELQKVASGGEMSRLMLCLKALLAEKKALPTIIFDEIDTGISGDVAHKMGSIFEKMADKMQVISITHLPQIASKGKHHLFVYKKDDKEQTSSFIKTLDQNERVVEIAKMLSTGKPTESAIKNASDLLNHN